MKYLATSPSDDCSKGGEEAHFQSCINWLLAQDVRETASKLPDQVVTQVKPCPGKRRRCIKCTSKGSKSPNIIALNDNIFCAWFMQHLLVTNVWNKEIVNWKWKNSLHFTNIWKCFFVVNQLEYLVFHFSTIAMNRSEKSKKILKHKWVYHIQSLHQRDQTVFISVV